MPRRIEARYTDRQTRKMLFRSCSNHGNARLRPMFHGAIFDALAQIVAGLIQAAASSSKPFQLGDELLVMQGQPVRLPRDRKAQQAINDLTKLFRYSSSARQDSYGSYGQIVPMHEGITISRETIVRIITILLYSLQPQLAGLGFIKRILASMVFAFVVEKLASWLADMLINLFNGNRDPVMAENFSLLMSAAAPA